MGSAIICLAPYNSANEDVAKKFWMYKKSSQTPLVVPRIEFRLEEDSVIYLPIIKCGTALNDGDLVWMKF